MSKLLPVLQDKQDILAGSEIRLADLHQSMLDWEALDCVLADLDDFADVQHIAVRDETGEETALSDIVVARQGFVDGIYPGLQIHYEFADTLWVDTFLREPNGAQLVRMSEQELHDLENEERCSY